MDKIKRDSSIYHKFIDYLYEESLENKNHIKISYDDNFYRDNCSFYLVLYDMVYIYYTDTIYVVNSLKYLNFGNEMTFTHSHSILFNFLIEKNFSTYLHYQTKLASKNGTFYNISIINEEGEEIINDTFNSVSGYIEIEPNVKYYAHINLFEIDTGYFSRTFSLNYEKYKNNILVEDEDRISRTIISAQNFTLFKSISNLIVNESIIFSGSFFGYYPNHEFYIKIYESDDFESLVDSFPIDKKDFDSKIEVKEQYDDFGSRFNKVNESQKGVLFGIFVGEEYSVYKRDPRIYFRIYKAQPKSDEEDSSSEDDTDNTDNKKESSLSTGWIVFIVIISVIIVGIIIIILVYLYHAKKRNNYQLKNDADSAFVNNNNDIYYNKIESNEEKAYYE